MSVCWRHSTASLEQAFVSATAARYTNMLCCYRLSVCLCAVLWVDCRRQHDVGVPAGWQVGSTNKLRQVHTCSQHCHSALPMPACPVCLHVPPAACKVVDTLHASYVCTCTADVCRLAPASAACPCTCSTVAKGFASYFTTLIGGCCQGRAGQHSNQLSSELSGLRGLSQLPQQAQCCKTVIVCATSPFCVCAQNSHPACRPEVRQPAVLCGGLW
jgi:hypothetical protein